MTSSGACSLLGHLENVNSLESGNQAEHEHARPGPADDDPPGHDAQCPGQACALLGPVVRLMLDGYAVRLHRRDDPPPLRCRE